MVTHEEDEKRACLQSVGSVAALYLLCAESAPMDINPFLLMGALADHDDPPVFDPKQISLINEDMGSTLDDWFSSTADYLTHRRFVNSDDTYAKASTLWMDVMDCQMVFFVFQCFCEKNILTVI